MNRVSKSDAPTFAAKWPAGGGVVKAPKSKKAKKRSAGPVARV